MKKLLEAISIIFFMLCTDAQAQSDSARYVALMKSLRRQVIELPELSSFRNTFYSKTKTCTGGMFVTEKRDGQHATITLRFTYVKTPYCWTFRLEPGTNKLTITDNISQLNISRSTYINFLRNETDWLRRLPFHDSRDLKRSDLYPIKS